MRLLSQFSSADFSDIANKPTPGFLKSRYSNTSSTLQYHLELLKASSESDPIIHLTANYTGSLPPQPAVRPCTPQILNEPRTECFWNEATCYVALPTHSGRELCISYRLAIIHVNAYLKFQLGDHSSG